MPKIVAPQCAAARQSVAEERPPQPIKGKSVTARNAASAFKVTGKTPFPDIPPNPLLSMECP